MMIRTGCLVLLCVVFVNSAPFQAPSEDTWNEIDAIAKTVAANADDELFNKITDTLHERPSCGPDDMTKMEFKRVWPQPEFADQLWRMLDKKPRDGCLSKAEFSKELADFDTDPQMAEVKKGLDSNIAEVTKAPQIKGRQCTPWPKCTLDENGDFNPDHMGSLAPRPSERFGAGKTGADYSAKMKQPGQLKGDRLKQWETQKKLVAVQSTTEDYFDKITTMMHERPECKPDELTKQEFHAIFTDDYPDGDVWRAADKQPRDGCLQQAEFRLLGFSAIPTAAANIVANTAKIATKPKIKGRQCTPWPKCTLNEKGEFNPDHMGSLAPRPSERFGAGKTGADYSAKMKQPGQLKEGRLRKWEDAITGGGK